MTGRAASRHEHQRFCTIEGWDEVRNARGKPTKHHLTYELALDDGRILRTRISRPADTTSYGPSIWAHILDDQLCVTEDEFWTCVNNQTPPSRRSTAANLPPRNALPAGLAYQLVDTLGLTHRKIAAMTIDEAVARMQAHWSQERDDLGRLGGSQPDLVAAPRRRADPR